MHLKWGAVVFLSFRIH